LRISASPKTEPSRLRKCDAAEEGKDWLAEECGWGRGSIVAVAELPDQLSVVLIDHKTVVVRDVAGRSVASLVD
jgi:hypothetical protein